jgi:hypothetical protein
VVVARSGQETYEVMLINDRAQVVAHATADLPSPRANQLLVDLPLVSASNTRVYYRDGNTVVRALSPTGGTAPAITIPDGSSSEVAFAVSPDDQRIAIAEINEASSSLSDDTGQGYVEDLSTGGDRVSLWNNDGLYALRFPVGWDGTSLIDEIPGSLEGCWNPICSISSYYHVVDPTTGDATAEICQTSTSQPAYGTANATVTKTYAAGQPTPAGTACEMSADRFDQNGSYAAATISVESVSWNGTATTFTQFSVGASESWELSGCFLSPDGSRMACTAGSSNALALLSSSGTVTDTGHQYQSILGWIDPTHLLVYVNDKNLGVLDPDTGSLTTVVSSQAGDPYQMMATLPGAL